MKRQAPKKLEIFLFLALRERMRNLREVSADSEDENHIQIPETEENFTAFIEQLSKQEAEKFKRLEANFQNKPEEEKQTWLENIKRSIGAEDFSIDDTIHRSHVETILQRETLAIQKIIKSSLPSVYGFNSEESELTETSPEKIQFRYGSEIEKTVRKSFADQFVALLDLPERTVFDRLSGAQLARLVRLAGIREVTFACARIESVELLGAFLRRFAPEDARAIASQLSGLPKISDDRLAFAETIVQNALEIEPQPTSAMLDWLGIRLVGIMLCAREESSLRIAYTEQKLPRETAPRLSEIIEIQCRQTPSALKQKIGAEIEKMAEMVKSSETKSEQNKK